MASEAGRDDLGIIKDEEVAGTEPCADVIESGFVPRGGGALEDQETGVVALRRRMLGDEFLGEVEVEVSDSHGGSWGGSGSGSEAGRRKWGRCNRGGKALEFRVKSLGMSQLGVKRTPCEEHGDNSPGICSIGRLTDSVEKWHEKGVLRVVRSGLEIVSGLHGLVEARFGGLG